MEMVPGVAQGGAGCTPESPGPQSRSLNEGFEGSAVCPTHSNQLGDSKGPCYLSRASCLHWFYIASWKTLMGNKNILRSEDRHLWV